MEHIFTENIKTILEKHFGENCNDIFERSHLIQYLNEKTRSANKGSKSRGSFGALYSIYTLVEDYIKRGFLKEGKYSEFEGARQSSLIERQRELPFGNKLQNHYFQNRTNTDYRKFFPTAGIDRVIIHDQAESKYWINESQLKISINGHQINIAPAIIEIIDEYVKTKQDSFQRFVKACEDLQKLENNEGNNIQDFITSLLAPNVDARLFEIVSYSILKYYFYDKIIMWGYEIEKLNSENLKLYKTGRTNANDGGIDFVMRPLGRFFQVTETIDFKKYFLDIDKIQKYPITFVIKSDESIENLLKKIRSDANKSYSIKAVVDKYMDCIEEIINIPTINDRFKDAVQQGHLNPILDEIIVQSKVEFNYDDSGIEEDDD